MAKQQATHIGECQICGHVQKLPNGFLSLHGYTKKWGFFSGTCNGSRYLPFEQSKDRIQQAVDSVKKSIESAKQNAADILASDAFYIWIYVAATWQVRQSGYREVKLTEAEVSLDGRFIKFIDPKTGAEAKEQRSSLSVQPDGNGGWRSPEIADFAKESREKKARQIQARIKEMQMYVEWQEKRMADWAPKELKPVAAK